MLAPMISRRCFLATSAALAQKKERLIVDTHLEVWTLDPKFPCGHPERPEMKPDISAPNRKPGRGDEGFWA